MVLLIQEISINLKQGASNKLNHYKNGDIVRVRRTKMVSATDAINGVTEFSMDIKCGFYLIN